MRGSKADKIVDRPLMERCGGATQRGVGGIPTTASRRRRRGQDRRDRALQCTGPGAPHNDLRRLAVFNNDEGYELAVSTCVLQTSPTVTSPAHGFVGALSPPRRAQTFEIPWIATHPYSPGRFGRNQYYKNLAEGQNDLQSAAGRKKCAWGRFSAGFGAPKAPSAPFEYYVILQKPILEALQLAPLAPVPPARPR